VSDPESLLDEPEFELEPVPELDPVLVDPVLVDPVLVDPVLEPDPVVVGSVPLVTIA